MPLPQPIMNNACSVLRTVSSQLLATATAVEKGQSLQMLGDDEGFVPAECIVRNAELWPAGAS